MKRKIIKYKTSLKQFARRLRSKSTLGEVLLWQQVKGRQVRGYDFHRQRPVDRYIVDFYCSELSLAIEIDGGSHNEKFEFDLERQERIESLGIHVLRFSESEVRHNLSRVVQTIDTWIEGWETKKRHTPSQLP